MANFQYMAAGGTAWTDVPAAAQEGSAEGGGPVVVYPVATDRDGNGAPCGAIGRPTIELRSTVMSGAGFAFWQGLAGGTAASESGTAWLKAYDPRAGAWTGWQGLVTRPVFGRMVVGASSPVYFDVVVTVVECVAAAV